jgi:predicted dehydrogenase
MSRLRVAIIGCGWAGDLQMTRGFTQLPDLFEVYVCCSRGAAGRQAFAARYNIALQAERLEAVLAMPDIDVVSICTPPPLHHSMILASLAADKHVICEKPLVGSLQQLDEVVSAERKTNRRVMPIFQYRFGGAVSKLREIIGSGLAGRPYAASVETLLRRSADYYRVEWRGKFATELGGVLVTQAIHNHDLLLHLLGPVSSVAALKSTRVNPIEVEDCAVASLCLESGALVSIMATLGSVRPSSRIRLCFEHVSFERQCFDGATSQLAEEPWEFAAANPDSAGAITAIMQRPASGHSGFAGQFVGFHRAVQRGTPLPVTLQDARRSLELISALFHSAETGQQVSLPLPNTHPTYSGWVK